MSKILLWLIFAFGTSDHHIVLINHSGLKIVRIEIDGRKFEQVEGQAEQILVSVTPGKHDMKLFFKGGAEVDWPDFDFKGVYQITFERVKNRINAHTN